MLSVIVPVYQEKKYLKDCVDSILNQTYKDLEIILVDDGSTDGSADICDEIAKDGNNVKVIHIDNSGIYNARKIGVKNANGDLITFVDADDWIDKEAYQKLIHQLEEVEADIILFAYRYNNNGSAILHKYEEGIYDSKKISKVILPTMIWDDKIGERRLDPSLCCKIIKKDLYNKITSLFDGKVILGEDALVSYPLIAVASRIYINNNPFYHYRIHNESSVNNYPLERVMQLQLFQSEICLLMKKFGGDIDYSFQIDCYLRTFIDEMIKNWFGVMRTSDMYRFPYEVVWGEKKIKLYGAGLVGRTFRRLLANHQIPQVVGWYDKNQKEETFIDGYCVLPANKINKNDDVPILIAVEDEQLVHEIRKELVEMGIPSKLIIWKKPIHIG